MRIFQRFIFAFGDRKYGDFVFFTQIEAGRAYEVADVFDKQNTVIVQWQARRGAASAIICASRWQPLPVFT